MARSAKTAPAPVAAARTKAPRQRAPQAEPVPVPVKAKTGKAKPDVAKVAPRRPPVVVEPIAAAPVRVPPPSKGDLRAEIEKLTAGNADLKKKLRVARAAVKEAGRLTAELEEELVQLRAEVSKNAAAAVPAKGAGRRSARRGKPVDPGDGVPPGVAVLEPQPLDAEALAAREALEDHLSGGEKQEG